jgi:hypothetical protein
VRIACDAGALAPGRAGPIDAPDAGIAWRVCGGSARDERGRLDC